MLTVGVNVGNEAWTSSDTALNCTRERSEKNKSQKPIVSQSNKKERKEKRREKEKKRKRGKEEKSRMKRKE